MYGISGANGAFKRNAAERQRERERAFLPSRWGAPVPSITRAVIIGGNPFASGLEGIAYAASVAPLAVYDPDVDTAFPDGLGTCWVYINGLRQLHKYLFRHNFLGDQSRLITSREVGIIGSETLSFGGTDMTALTASWV